VCCLHLCICCDHVSCTSFGRSENYVLVVSLLSIAVIRAVRFIGKIAHVTHPCCVPRCTSCGRRHRTPSASVPGQKASRHKQVGRQTCCQTRTADDCEGSDSLGGLLPFTAQTSCPTVQSRRLPADRRMICRHDAGRPGRSPRRRRSIGVCPKRASLGRWQGIQVRRRDRDWRCSRRAAAPGGGHVGQPRLVGAQLRRRDGAFTEERITRCFAICSSVDYGADFKSARQHTCHRRHTLLACKSVCGI